MPSPSNRTLSMRKSPWTIALRDCSGSVSGQEGDQPLHFRDIVGLRVAVLPRPARHLPFEIIAGFAEIAQLGGFWVDRVQIGERIDELLVHSPPRVRIEVGKRAIGVGPALRQLHHVKHRSDHIGVAAKRERCRHRKVERVKRRKKPIFAIDCVRRGKQPAEGLAPQHIIARRGTNAVGWVRLARREFDQLEWSAEPFDIGLEPRPECLFVQRLLAHRCFLNSRRAIARRCTSSGPSASRSVRIEA